MLGRFAAETPGFFESARTGERVESIPALGSSQRRVVSLAAAEGLGGDAAVLLPGVAKGEPHRWALPAGLPSGALVEAQSCDGLPFARFGTKAGTVSAPEGCLRMRLAAPGYATGPWLAPSDLATAASTKGMPRAGSLHWAIREKGATVLPARILLRGVGNPDPDWGSDPVEGVSLNVIHTDHDGELPIPPGHYRHGHPRPQYTLAEKDIVVDEGKTTLLAAELARVVDTSGWISADLHVHASPRRTRPHPSPTVWWRWRPRAWRWRWRRTTTR